MVLYVSLSLWVWLCADKGGGVVIWSHVEKRYAQIAKRALADVVASYTKVTFLC